MTTEKQKGKGGAQEQTRHLSVHIHTFYLTVSMIKCFTGTAGTASVVCDTPLKSLSIPSK